MSDQDLRQKADKFFRLIEHLFMKVVFEYNLPFEKMSRALDIKKQFYYEMSNVRLIVTDSRYISLELKHEEASFLVAGRNHNRDEYDRLLKRLIPFGYFFHRPDRLDEIQSEQAQKAIMRDPYYVLIYQDNESDWLSSLGPQASDDAKGYNLSFAEVVLQEFEDAEGHIYDLQKLVNLLVSRPNIYVNGILNRDNPSRELERVKKENKELINARRQDQEHMIRDRLKAEIVAEVFRLLGHAGILTKQTESQRLTFDSLVKYFKAWVCPPIEIVEQMKSEKHDVLLQDTFRCKPFPISLPNGRKIKVEVIKKMGIYEVHQVSQVK